MGVTNINWADKVWNPVTGCTKVSAGCKNCYAERMSKRLAGRCGYPKDNPFAVTLHPEKLDEPLHWKKPSRIFVCSMGDLFHEDVPDEFIDNIFAVMALSPQHTFLVLTKRPERMAAYMTGRDWGEAANYIFDGYIRRLEGQMFMYGEIVPPLPNVHLGVSVEDQQTADERIPLLLQTPAAKRFVSYEPALGPVDFTNIPIYNNGALHRCNALKGYGGWGDYDRNKYCLDQIIMGGESGPGARPMHPDWARSVRDQCQAAGVAFWFKQWGEWWPHDQGQWLSEAERYVHPDTPDAEHYRVGKKAAGCLLDGVEHKEVAG